MRHQSREEEKRKKRLTSAETGSKGRQPAPEVLIDDEIDPADFFDPEDFGFRRKRESSNP
jgi:hypothetical protein